MKKFIQFLFICLLCINYHIESKYDTKINNNSIITNDTILDMESRYNQLYSASPNVVYHDQYYAGYYFKNLAYNFPLNSHGSCNYTAVAMLLSYFDTYWDDTIIPEQYEQISIASSSNLPELNTFHSPGVVSEQENVWNMSNQTYTSFVYSTANIYFQSYLINLMLNNVELNETSLGLDLNGILQLLNKYFNKQNKSFSDMFNMLTRVNSNDIVEFAKTHILQGRPVLLRLRNTNTGEGHTVIAYDCNGNDIFVHTGWQKNSTVFTHTDLNALPYNRILDATVLIPRTSHVHSNNYRYGYDSVCSCRYLYPTNISINNNYRDVLPTFKINALTKERWINSENYTYKLTLSNVNSSISYDNIESNKYTITKNADWNDMIKNNNPYSTSVQFVYSGNDEYYSSISISKAFSSPKEYKDISSLKPIDYNAPTTSYTSFLLTNHDVKDLTFSTSQYRTKYDEANELLIMSSINYSNNISFINYDLDTAITRFDFQMSIKEDSESDLLNNYQVDVMEYKNGEYTSLYSLPNESQSLGVGKGNLKTFSVFFDNPIEYISLRVSYTGEENTTSEGNVYLGNVALYKYDSNECLPTSGYELPYEPEKWNVANVSSFNCYNYALNNMENNSIQPGFGTDEDSYYDKGNLNDVVERIKIDSSINEFVFIEINRYEICPVGTYKIALLLDSEGTSHDFHFYRQNSDGTWSHKQGTLPITNLDFNGNIIADPKLCSHYFNTGNDVNYNVFAGYYAVSPMN